MKNSVIRLIFVLSIVAAVGIIISQIYWVKKAYDLEDKDFDYKVTSSLKNVALKIWEIKKSQATLYDVVEQINPGYFIVQVNNQISDELLEHFLKEQFELHNLITDFEYGQYDCAMDTMVSMKYVSMLHGNAEKDGTTISLPIEKRENYYFSVHFPNRKEYVGEQLHVWIYSSLFLLAVIIILTLTVYVVMKQKRLSEVQKDFVNNMTHEFKTPLATIQLSAEVLKRPDIIEKPQRLLNYATIIDKEASLLALQVERVLQMAHAEKGEIILKKEPTNINKLVAETFKSFEDKFIQSDITAQLDIIEKDLMANIDVLHIKNAISNLIENAIKYSGEGASITVRLNGNDKTVKIAVEDNGPGIADEYQKMLFNRFFRVPKGNRHDVKGFGIGLNYVKIISTSHGGDIICKSKEGVGTTFIITLPTLGNEKKRI
jgi:two-component system phosphate regulon sensor histidine kinase PhoR